MKKTVVLIALCCLIAVSGCTGAPAPAQTPAPTASPAPAASPTLEPVTEDSYAIVARAYEEDGARYVDVDYINIVRHSASELAEDGLPYGYEWLEIRNYNEQLRTYRVASSARFRMSTDGVDPAGSYAGVTWEYFMEHATEPFLVYEVDYPAYFHIYIRGSELVSANFFFEYYVPSIN